MPLATLHGIPGLHASLNGTLKALMDAKFAGKTITDFCDGGYTDASFNHCAHFVSHVLDYGFGFTCRGMTGKGSSPATLRVHELFARCPAVGRMSDFQGIACLAFVTDAGNVDLENRKMSNVPKKHVGIYVQGWIWHYSNTRDKVISQTPEDFGRHYRGDSIEVFYGTFPQS